MSSRIDCWIRLLVFVCIFQLFSGTVGILIQEAGNAKEFRSLSAIPAINKVWIINLVTRNNRMEFMDRQMRTLKIPFDRMEAFTFGNGSEAKTEETMKRLDPQTKMNLDQVREDMKVATDQTWGAVGCWQSHLQIYFEILHGKASVLPGPFLVLEDDVKIDTSISRFLSYEYLYETLPSDWEMLYLDHIGLKCRENSTSASKEFCAVYFTFGTGGYVIRNREVAEKLIAAGNTPGLEVADRFINPLFQQGKIIAYAFLTHPVEQLPEEFGSDIRSARALKFTIAKFYASKKNRTALRG